MPIILKLSRQEVENFIKENYKDMSYEHMAAELGISATTINRVIKGMSGVTFGRQRTEKRKLIEERLDFIRNNPDLSKEEIGEMFNVAPEYINKLMRTSGLRKKQKQGTNSNKPHIEKHYNGIFNVGARWNWLVG